MSSIKVKSEVSYEWHFEVLLQRRVLLPQTDYFSGRRIHPVGDAASRPLQTSGEVAAQVCHSALGTIMSPQWDRVPKHSIPTLSPLRPKVYLKRALGVWYDSRARRTGYGKAATAASLMT